MENFRKELEQLINKNSMENGSNTPDYILADYLTDCLMAFDKAMKTRDRFYQPLAEMSATNNGEGEES